MRVVVPDMGGGFGLKIHVYGDEMAAIAASLLHRPAGEVHRRPAGILRRRFSRARTPRQGAHGASRAPAISLAVEVDDLYGIGPYSGYPRGGANEGLQVVNLAGAPYRNRVYRGARPRRISEQADVWPVPRGRPSGRVRGHRRAGRSRCGRGRHGSRRVPAPQLHCRRQLSAYDRRAGSCSRGCRSTRRSTGCSP